MKGLGCCCKLQPDSKTIDGLGVLSWSKDDSLSFRAQFTLNSGIGGRTFGDEVVSPLDLGYESRRVSNGSEASWRRERAECSRHRSHRGRSRGNNVCSGIRDGDYAQ